MVSCMVDVENAVYSFLFINVLKICLWLKILRADANTRHAIGVGGDAPVVCITTKKNKKN